MDSDQNCYNETEPIFEQGYRGRGSDSNMMNVVEKMIEGLKERGVRVQVMNITQLSEYRKDGHPSIFRKQWEPLTEEQIKNPSSYADCIHWCLPGVPDVWNKLLYAYISSWTHRSNPLFCSLRFSMHISRLQLKPEVFIKLIQSFCTHPSTKSVFCMSLFLPAKLKCVSLLYWTLNMP